MVAYRPLYYILDILLLRGYLNWQQSKSCSKGKAELDRISNLPSDVIGQVLSLLPIEEAVKTSVLSNKWRFNAAMLPRLVFDDQCIPTQDGVTFADIVDQVLLLHLGPIHTFKLSHPRLLAVSHIDRWILHLSRSSIKKFRLNIQKENPYKLSSWLFSCQDLESLKLVNCFLKPPSTFKGFRSLKSLCMDQVVMPQRVFDNLIVSCPLLERLTLTECSGFSHIKIDAPNLQFFHFEGSFAQVTLKNTVNLAEVCIYLLLDHCLVPAKFSHLVKFFVHLPRIRRLSIRTCFLQYLAVGALPQKLPNPCLNLNFLSVSIDFSDQEEVSTAQCLLRSSPALQELEIEALETDEDVSSRVDDNWNCSFTQLRLVKISDISGDKVELDLVKFLLLCSPVLERMTIKPAASVTDSTELLKKLIRFRRASVHSEIVYLDP